MAFAPDRANHVAGLKASECNMSHDPGRGLHIFNPPLAFREEKELRNFFFYFNLLKYPIHVLYMIISQLKPTRH